jgi:hypothetical protein
LSPLFLNFPPFTLSIWSGKDGEIIIQYDSIEDLVDDGWRLDWGSRPILPFCGQGCSGGEAQTLRLHPLLNKSGRRPCGLFLDGLRALDW